MITTFMQADKHCCMATILLDKINYIRELPNSDNAVIWTDEAYFVVSKTTAAKVITEWEKFLIQKYSMGEK